MSSYLQELSAVTIQRYYRGYTTRKWFNQQLAYLASLAHVTTLSNEEVAASIIQRCWTSYRNKRIYRFYRDIIQFRERGDPKELLKVINPREASLVDAAAGVHVRFRLGGSTFPPFIFYKIFTHRPVTDICSFCPRDYVNERKLGAGEVNNKPSAGASNLAVKKTKDAPAREGDFVLDESMRAYRKPDGSTGYRSNIGWYERIENNGWRPVNERILVDEDPITSATKARSQPMFHHDLRVRRAERERQAKQRKREWLMKLYRDGMVTHDAGAAAHAISQLEAGADPASVINEDDSDTLLKWTDQLDFDSYLSDWSGLACTLASEAYLPVQEGPLLAPLPGQDLNFHEALATAKAAYRAEQQQSMAYDAQFGR